jgi:alanine racemase
MAEAIINLNALKENLKRFRELTCLPPIRASRMGGPPGPAGTGGCEVIAVVKANAYGHGAVGCSRAFIEAGAKMLAVATVEEASELRQAAILAPILLLSASLPEEVPAIFENQITPSITDLEMARRLSLEAKRRGERLPVHIKLDTGLGRIGLPAVGKAEIKETAAAIEEMMGLAGITIEGIYTHFASPTSRLKSFSRRQMASFKELLKLLPDGGERIPFRHIASSGAVLSMRECYQPPFNLIRPGLGLYGLYYQRSPRKVPLEPALRLTSRIVFLKTLPPGRSVSYGRRYTTSRHTQVATVAFGYADGYSRGLSNKARLEVGGKFCPVIGTVCMDQIMVDVSEVPDVKIGDEAVVYSDKRDAPNSVENIASLLKTVPNEVTCAIGRRVKRIYRP